MEINITKLEETIDSMLLRIKSMEPEMLKTALEENEIFKNIVPLLDHFQSLPREQSLTEAAFSLLAICESDTDFVQNLHAMRTNELSRGILIGIKYAQSQKMEEMLGVEA